MMARRGEGIERRKIINQLSNLVAKGMGNREAKEWVMETYGKSIATAERYLRAVHAEQARRISKQRPVLVARQSAKLDAAQRTAMTAVRHFSHQGEVIESRPEPDVGAFTAAVVAQNRLLGLNAPEKHEHMVLNIQAMVVDIAELVRDFLPAPALRRQFLAALQERVEKRLAERPGLLPAMQDAERAVVGAVGGEVVVVDEGTPKSLGDTPPPNGTPTNGRDG